MLTGLRGEGNTVGMDTKSNPGKRDTFLTEGTALTFQASASTVMSDPMVRRRGLAECSSAGVVDVTRRGWIHIPSGVMGLVYSDGYFDSLNF